MDNALYKWNAPQFTQGIKQPGKITKQELHHIANLITGRQLKFTIPHYQQEALTKFQCENYFVKENDAIIIAVARGIISLEKKDILK